MASMRSSEDVMTRYFRKFGQSFSAVLYQQLPTTRRKEIDISMAKALAEQRDVILDEELFPNMNFTDNRIRF